MTSTNNVVAFFLRKNESANERRFLRPLPTPLPLGLYECNGFLT